MDEFSVSVKEHRGVSLIVVEGEFDLGGADAFAAARDEALAAQAPLVVDLTACTFIDSTAIGCVIRSFEHADHAGVRFAIVGPNAQVERVLELVGVTSRVPHYATRDEAAAALADGDAAAT